MDVTLAPLSQRFGRSGFTLTEVLVSLVIAGVVMGAVYSAYYSQQKSYRNQEQAAAMQQNLRAAMLSVERALRMAGCDPTGTANAGVVTASAGSIRITLDTTGGGSDGVDNDGDGSTDEADEVDLSDGDTNDAGEDVTFSLYDSGGDGDNDLGRKVGAGTNQPVAENIDGLNFVYLDANNGVLDDDGNGNVIASIAAIRSVQITLVARAERPDPQYTDANNYENAQGTVIISAPNDNFRRRRLAKQIQCRNLGLN